MTCAASRWHFRHDNHLRRGSGERDRREIPRGERNKRVSVCVDPQYVNKDGPMTDTATVTAEDQLAIYRQRREQAVVQPRGNLALVNTQWIDSPQPVYGVPGTWAPLPAGESGLKVTAAASDNIRVDGEVVDG